MAYDEGLADRVRDLLIGQDEGQELKELKMFGGLAFMLNGNMACGVMNDDLIVRLDKERASQAFEDPHTRPFDFTGKPLGGFVVVAPAGIEDDTDLALWVKKATEFAESLPPK
jgi:TfoX/Sxy family transcriptional regulator of competence genes